MSGGPEGLRTPRRRSRPGVVAGPGVLARPGVLAGLLGLVGLVGLTGCDGSVFGSDDGSGRSFLVPTEVAPGTRFSAVGAGWFHTCATAASGGVYCWGKSAAGELGGPTPPGCSGGEGGRTPCTGTPQRVEDAPPLREIAAGIIHTCGLDAHGQAWCWGARHALGDGLPDGSPADARVPCTGDPDFVIRCRAFAAPVQGDARFGRLQIDVGGTGTCAVAEGGGAWCWNLQGPVAMGLAPQHVPTSLPTDLVFDHVMTRGMVGCGLVQGEAWCWGSNWHGSIGTGAASQGIFPNPVRVMGGHTFTGLALTESSVCGLREDGSAWCWGNLPGHGPPWYGSAPVAVGGPSFVALAGGGNHHCGLTAEGEAWCWGTNAFGYLGDGSTQDRSDPTPVRAPAGVRFTRLALGGVHSCGLATDGRLFCWGHNNYGQVGRRP